MNASSPTSSTPSTPSAPTYDAAADAETLCSQRANGQISQIARKFDWTEGDDADAKLAARPVWEKEFKEHFIANCTSANQKKKCASKAQKSADAKAREAMVPLAEALAVSRAQAICGSEAAFDASDLGVDGKDALDKFNAGTDGQKAKHYGTALNGLSASQMETLLDSDGSGTRTDGTTAGTKRHWMWEFPDGSVVRVKPDGDAFKNEEMFAVEFKKTGTSASGQEAVAAKIDDSGSAVPKGPDAVANPYDQKYAEQREAYQMVMVEAGHRKTGH